MPADQPLPLREQNKHRTRALIAAAAEALFARNGFADVTFDDVAKAAGVSRQTVFNYFPVKEDLVFDRSPQLETQLVEPVRNRAPGVGVVAAFRDGHHTFWSALRSPAGPRAPGGYFDLVAASPSLQTYARELNARTARRLAEVIAAGRPDRDDMRPRVLAEALMAVYAATSDAVQDRVVARQAPAKFLDAVLAEADRAFDMLDVAI